MTCQRVTGFVIRVTRQVPHVEQDILTRPEPLCLTCISRIRVVHFITLHVFGIPVVMYATISV
jgi:hypothetical protein